MNSTPVPINLGDLRRHLSRHLTDTIFDGLLLESRDWHSSVPAAIRDVWREMNMNERLGVYLMAQYATPQPR